MCNDMKQFFKKYWWVILLLLFLLPFLLNWIVTRNIIMSYRVAGEPKDWIAFWVTYLSAIASFTMVVITWITLKQNKEQLNELKRQWKEDNRARICISIVPIEDIFCFKIQNIGKRIAYDVNIKFSDDLLNSLPEGYELFLKKIENKGFIVTPYRIKYIPLFRNYINENTQITIETNNQEITGKEVNDWLKNNINLRFTITGTYKDDMSNYNIDEKFSIDDFVIGDLEKPNEIPEAIKQLNETIKNKIECRNLN